MQEFASREHATSVRKELLPGGTPPEFVQKFIDGGIVNTPEGKELAKSAAEWLTTAVVHAHADSKVKKAAVDLLVTGPSFSSNMAFLGVFDEPFRSGLTANLQRLGAKLKTRFDELDLGTVLGETAVDDLTWHHELARKAAAEGRDFTMTEVLPDFPEEFRNAPENEEILEMYGERCYLLSTLLLSMAVDRFFQAAVAEVARKVGLSEDAVRAAIHKAYVRARNKMDSKDDHRAKPKPRPAYNIDLIRCLAMAMSPEMVLAFYAALLERFGGAGKVKNLFALPEDERADRFHLASLMVTVVYDANMSYAELCQLPETRKLWDDYLGTPDKGEPKDRWGKMGAVARRYLEGLGSRRVVALGEVQILLREFAEIRREMHSPYKCWRAADPTQLCNDYLQGRPEKMMAAPRSLWSACLNGQRDVAERFIAEGGDVNTTLTQHESPLSITAANNHLDVARLLLSKGADVNLATTDNGTSPLYIASQQGHLDVARLLLSKGAGVNQQNTLDGRSPLFQASMNNHIDMVKLLMANNADPTITTTEATGSFTALKIGSSQGHDEVAEYLRSKGPRE